MTINEAISSPAVRRAFMKGRYSFPAPDVCSEGWRAVQWITYITVSGVWWDEDTLHEPHREPTEAASTTTRVVDIHTGREYSKRAVQSIAMSLENKV